MTEKPEGLLAKTFREAMMMAEQMRAAGVPPDQIEAGITATLREAWPKGRNEPWHYFCDDCSDCGYIIRNCVGGTCGRPFKLPLQGPDDKTGQGQCRGNHTFAEPCWCKYGQEKRRQLMRQPRAADDAVAAAAKTSKPTRVGR